MKTTRRAFLTTALGAGLSASGRLTAAERSGPDKAALDRILAEPVLRRELFKSPVKIESLELLRDGAKFLVRARSTDGAESVTVPNNSRLLDVYPMYLKRVAPFFVDKDARDLESLLAELYRDQSNYKFQGLAFWVCVATVEMAMLDLMGQIAGAPIGELLGTVRRSNLSIPTFIRNDKPADTGAAIAAAGEQEENPDLDIPTFLRRQAD